MKKTLLILLILFASRTAVFPQADTANKKPGAKSPGTSQNEKLKTNDPVNYTLTLKDVEEVKDSLKVISAKVSLISTKTCKYDEPKEPEGLEWFLIFSPVFIFILVGFAFGFAVSDFSFTEALKENELSKITVPNPYYTGLPTPPGAAETPLTMEVTPNVSSKPNALGNQAAVQPVVANQPQYEIKDADKSYRPSISRYIALISSLLIIIIAVCMSSFFIYHYLRTGCPPDLGALTTVILALGIGIVPYAANKVSAAVATNQSKD